MESPLSGGSGEGLRPIISSGYFLFLLSLKMPAYQMGEELREHCAILMEEGGVRSYNQL